MLKELNEIRKPERFRIDYGFFAKIQKAVLKQLGHSNINQLRDRFEGQRYLNSTLLKAYAYASVQRLLGVQVDHHKLLQEIRSSTISHNGIDYEMLVSDMDSLPMVPKSNCDSAILVFVNIMTRETVIVGTASFQTIIANLDRTPLSPMYEKNFQGFLKNLTIFEPLK